MWLCKGAHPVGGAGRKGVTRRNARAMGVRPGGGDRVAWCGGAVGKQSGGVREADAVAAQHRLYGVAHHGAFLHGDPDEQGDLVTAKAAEPFADEDHDLVEKFQGTWRGF